MHTIALVAFFAKEGELGVDDVVVEDDLLNGARELHKLLVDAKEGDSALILVRLCAPVSKAFSTPVVM